MKNHKIESVTLWKENAEFRVKRRNVISGDVHITTSNRLNKEEVAFISQFLQPYCDCWILQWHENDLKN